MAQFPLLIAALALLSGLFVVIPRVIFGPVPRIRVERFARRQGLLITPDNGNLVIRYLATTRRWRAAGLIAAIVPSIAWAAREGRLSVNFLTAFAGWFVGAVIAEFRIVTAEPGPRRSASLAPRLLRHHVRPVARGGVLVMAAVVLALTVTLLLAALAGRSVNLPDVLLHAGLGVAAVAVPAWCGRQILARPQPLGLSADIRAADDALRDRSLHVLAGSAIALLAYQIAGLLAELPTAFGASDESPPWLAVVALLALLGPLGGYLIATRSRPLTRNSMATPIRS